MSTGPVGFAFSHRRGPLPATGQCTLVEGPFGTGVTYTRTGTWRMFARHLQQVGDRAMRLSTANLRATPEPAALRVLSLV